MCERESVSVCKKECVCPCVCKYMMLVPTTEARSARKREEDLNGTYLETGVPLQVGSIYEL